MDPFSALLALCAGNSPVPVNSPHKGQWRGALKFSLIRAWINDWVNNREAGDLRRHRGHHGVNVMWLNVLLCSHNKTEPSAHCVHIARDILYRPNHGYRQGKAQILVVVRLKYISQIRLLIHLFTVSLFWILTKYRHPSKSMPCLRHTSGF